MQQDRKWWEASSVSLDASSYYSLRSTVQLAFPFRSLCTGSGVTSIWLHIILYSIHFRRLLLLSLIQHDRALQKPTLWASARNGVGGCWSVLYGKIVHLSISSPQRISYYEVKFNTSSLCIRSNTYTFPLPYCYSPTSFGLKTKLILPTAYRNNQS